MNLPPDTDSKKPARPRSKQRLRRFLAPLYLKRLKRARARTRRRAKKETSKRPLKVSDNESKGRDGQPGLRVVVVEPAKHMKLLKSLASLLVKQSLGDVHER